MAKYPRKPTASSRYGFFDGETCRYRDRCENGDAARNDPFGFYHGMIVSHAGQDFVLCGPPETFQPGEAEQLLLF